MESAMSSSDAVCQVCSQRKLLGDPTTNGNDQFLRNENQRWQENGDCAHDVDCRAVDTVDAVAQIRPWHHENLEHAIRKMKINETSAEDDDSEPRPSSDPLRKLGACQSGSLVGEKTSEATPPFEYRMSRARRGRALIVNNVTFSPRTGMPSRAGSEKDAVELAGVLGQLGFCTERYSNLTCLQLVRIFQDVSEEDHSDDDCFVFALMTHGTDGAVYCTDGVLKLDDLMQELKGDRCATLAGKPKLLFIQACRGQRFDEGVELAGEDEADGGGSGGGRPVVIPAEADFLVAYSSPPGYYSWRNNGTGAWFIQALVKVLREHGTSLEISQVLTRVNRLVAYECTSASSVPDLHGKKQMPYYTSTLTKELYLRAPLALRDRPSARLAPHV